MFRCGLPPPKAKTHPTEKPIGLLTQLIAATTRRGDLVVDPFADSGSTGEAAVRLGRSFVGIELDREHARRGRARIIRARKRQLQMINGRRTLTRACSLRYSFSARRPHC